MDLDQLIHLARQQSFSIEIEEDALSLYAQRVSWVLGQTSLIEGSPTLTKEAIELMVFEQTVAPSEPGVKLKFDELLRAIQIDADCVKTSDQSNTALSLRAHGLIRQHEGRHVLTTLGLKWLSLPLTS